MTADKVLKLDLNEGVETIKKQVGAASAAPAPDPYAVLGAVVDRTREPAPLEYIVEGLPIAPGGKVNALVGAPNAGKTPFALLLAISVAAGKAFFGHRILAPGPSLYLDFETGALAEIREARICKALGIERASVPLEIRHAEATLDETYIKALESYLLAHPKALVVVDTYGSAIAGDIDHNSTQFGHFLQQLGGLCRVTGAALLVLMHERKSDGGKRKGSALEMLAGSFAAPGKLQSCITLYREAGTSGEDAPIVVHCARAPETGFADFSIRWCDVANPDPAAFTPGARIKADPNRWGLRAELAADAPSKADTSADRLRNNRERLIASVGPRVIQLLAFNRCDFAKPATFKNVREWLIEAVERFDGKAITEKQTRDVLHALAAGKSVEADFVPMPDDDTAKTRGGPARHVWLAEVPAATGPFRHPAERSAIPPNGKAHRRSRGGI